MVRVEFVNRSAAVFPPALINRVVAAFYRTARVATSRPVSVALVNDAAIQKLNLRYRRKNRPTDVLSFRPRPGEKLFPHEIPALGEVIISYPYAARQAHELGHSVKHEIMTLLVHGLAHLLGHTHSRAPAAKKMSRLEARVMAALKRG